MLFNGELNQVLESGRLDYLDYITDETRYLFLLCIAFDVDLMLIYSTISLIYTLLSFSLSHVDIIVINFCHTDSHVRSSWAVAVCSFFEFTVGDME